MGISLVTWSAYLLLASGLTFGQTAGGETPALVGAASATAPQTGVARLTVRNEIVNTLDPRLFGQFMERAVDQGEYGPEATLVPGTRKVMPAVIQLMTQVAPTILRFPGGGGVENGPSWTNLVDGAWDRTDYARPSSKTRQGKMVGSEFGLDEFLKLTTDLKTEPLLVVSISKSFHAWEKETLAESIRGAQAMVAYVNGEAEGSLPEDLRHWAQLRVRNGHAKPYGVRFWQIGNEPIWNLCQHLIKAGKGKDEISRIYVQTLGAFIRAMRSVDPKIEVLVDVQMEDSQWVDIPVIDRVARELGTQVQYLTCHSYKPLSIHILQRARQPLEPKSLTAAEYWYAAQAVPFIDPESGLSCYRPRTLTKARRYGYQMGVTEWNWNGWWQLHSAERRELPNWGLAKGVASAGFLHAFMREGDTIRLATQSMFVGVAWDFAAIHVDAARKMTPFVNPCGLVAGLYARHHGNVVLPVTMENVGMVTQPIQMGEIVPARKLALLDPVATRTRNHLYLHVINRSFDQDIPVE
ncbi:MAG: hypothetical protein WCI73_19555, partial [Phycisphaerae bacterium]